jgi:hypothetical protein
MTTTTSTQPAELQGFSQDFGEASSMLKSVIDLNQSAVELSREGKFETALEYISSAFQEESDAWTPERLSIFNETAVDLIYQTMGEMHRNYQSTLEAQR